MNYLFCENSGNKEKFTMSKLIQGKTYSEYYSVHNGKVIFNNKDIKAGKTFKYGEQQCKILEVVA